MLKREEYITTFTGKRFHMFNATEKELDIIDAAHALSLQCRFNGHTSHFYSVASHSLIGSKLILNQFKKEFLLHDLQESWIGDLVTPIKRRTSAFIKMENKIEKVISKKYNIPFPMSKEVKEMDTLMFRMEFVYLMGQKSKELFPLTKKEFMKEINKPCQQIEKEFLNTYHKLKNT